MARLRLERRAEELDMLEPVNEDKKIAAFTYGMIFGAAIGLIGGAVISYDSNTPRKQEQLFLDRDDVPDLLVTNKIGRKSVHFGLRDRDGFVTFHSLDQLVNFQSKERMVKLGRIEQEYHY